MPVSNRKTEPSAARRAWATTTPSSPAWRSSSGKVNEPASNGRTSHRPSRLMRTDSWMGGGEGGIRTLDGLPHTAFPVRRHSPLGDLSGDEFRPFRRSQRKATTEPRRERTGGVRDRRGEGRQRRAGAASTGGVAERVGFEPTVLSHTAFRERHHQPLGHLSAGEDSKGTAVNSAGDGRVELLDLVPADAADDLQSSHKT